MININLPKLNIDCDITIDEEGWDVKVKNFNINNFVIDKVFKRFDKKIKRKNKSLQTDKQNIIDSVNESDEYIIKIE